MSEHESPEVPISSGKHIPVDHTSHSGSNCPWATSPGTPCAKMETPTSPRFKVVPATPNLASFKSPNRMYYVVRGDEILALCPTKEIANQIRMLLDWNEKRITI